MLSLDRSGLLHTRTPSTEPRAAALATRCAGTSPSGAPALEHGELPGIATIGMQPEADNGGVVIGGDQLRRCERHAVDCPTTPR